VFELLKKSYKLCVKQPVPSEECNISIS